MNRKRVFVCLSFVLPLAVALAFFARRTNAPALNSSTQRFDPTALKATLAARHELDSTLWASEQLALAHENTFVQLWDALRANPDTPAVISQFEFGSITIGEPFTTELKQHGLMPHAVDRRPKISAMEFRKMVATWQANGYELEQSEWHHEKFEQSPAGRHVSVIEVSLHIVSDAKNERIQMAGPLVVTWSGRVSEGFPIPDGIDARGLVVTSRQGAAPFELHFNRPLEKIQSEAAYSDVLATDLDNDGLVEIAYPRTNLLLRNLGNGEFEQEQLCDSPLQGICEGLLVDFNGDRRTDLMCAAINAEGTGRALFIYEADQAGNFSKQPRQLTSQQLNLLSPDSITVGDIDFDGDLDLFVTQYHAPYRDGKMPSPYYDANDGLPSYLLINDGSGRLRDATKDRGLADKRYRRTYRSSLVDLDDDGDLDLLVTSDFSGVDVYENNGRGFFHDVTELWFRQRSLFGMSHVIADFNNDAKLDIYATGMASTTARRLNAMGLTRSDFPNNLHWRSELAYGNRLYFRSGGASPETTYRQAATSDDVARAGWSWGCAALDVENDGDVDLYVANGHLSGRSSADYCTRFWCHDIYEGHTANKGFADLVKTNSLQLGTAVSWNGYEKNRLYLNGDGDGDGFTSAAFLMGVALEQDSRSVLAEDVDGDGRMDLLVGYADRARQPPTYTLRCWLNRWKTENHWIGVRLTGASGAMTMGAKVVVHTTSGAKIDTVITGESFASQQSPIAHFGLGDTSQVHRIVVHWVGGQVTRSENPAVDRYHFLRPVSE